MNQRLFATAVIVCASLVCGSGCGTRAQNEGAGGGEAARGEPTEYIFEPTFIRVDVGGEASFAEMSDLFLEANDYLDAGQYERAVEFYELIREHADEEAYLRASTYNIGLCREHQGYWAEAAEAYDEVISRWRESEDARLAFFRLAEVLAQRGEYAAIPFLLARAESRADLALRDRLELKLRVGFAYVELRQFADASEALDEVLRLNDHARQNWTPDAPDTWDAPVSDESWIIAQAHFGLGRVFHELSGEIKVILPTERMIIDLREKWELLTEAQAHYIEAIRAGNPYWSPLAGYMSGQVYEAFYFDVLASEVPDHYDGVVLEAYFTSLRERLDKYLGGALEVYESSLAMAYRIGAEDPVIDATLERIEFIVDYTAHQTGWAEEERLVVRDEHPNSASALEEMEFRDEAAGEELPNDASLLSVPLPRPSVVVSAWPSLSRAGVE